MPSTPRAALSVFDDPRAKLTELRQLYRRWASTNEVPPEVRPTVARAWQRSRASQRSPREPLPTETVLGRRERSTGLQEVLPVLQAMLLDVAEQAGNELVVCDADAVVLWLHGPRQVRGRSEHLGFVEGACWSEDSVGSNALGTSLVDAAPVQIFGPEHSDQGHHGWVCTGAPIIDPVRHAPLGAITLSGPLVSAHPNTLALVTAAATVAQESLRTGHRGRLHRLAAGAGQVSGPHLLVDSDGWVAASSGYRVGEQVWVPRTLAEGPVWLPTLGGFAATRVDGGWLLRPDGDPARTLTLLAGPEPAAVLTGGATEERIPLSRRHAQLLGVLARHPRGLPAHELAVQVYGAATDSVTVRAEVSRLRRRLGPLIGTRPYRLTVPTIVLSEGPDAT